MKNLVATILVITTLFSTATAQDVYSSSGRALNNSKTNVKSDKMIDPDRLIFGGWGVFGIGAGITNVGITPIVGYRITDEFSAGVGFGYQYLRVKDYFSVIIGVNGEEEFKPLNAHFYSPSVWARYRVWNNIFAHVEYEHNISSYKEYTNDFTQFPPPAITRQTTVSIPSLLVGGGIRQPLGGSRASFVFMVLYDVLQNPQSPYYNTVAMRVGLNVGF